MQNLAVFNPDYYLNQQGSLFPYEPRNLSEIVWPSANKVGIPELDVDMQAHDIIEPFTIWGDNRRAATMTGTYAFYTDDYKFTALWAQPNTLLKSCCHVAIEPNFSIRPRMPFPVALYELFRKRWLSRYWQSQGMQIIVDMNVAPCYLALNLIGVPKGWKIYATRAHKGEHDILIHVYNLCKFHADAEPVFIVYGGGQDIEAICRMNGWRWLPEKMHRQRRQQQQVNYEQEIKRLCASTRNVL